MNYDFDKDQNKLENHTDFQYGTDLLQEEELKKQMKKMQRRGARRGIIGTLIVCILVFGGFSAYREAALGQARVAVMVTEDGKQRQEILTYDSLLDDATVQKINYLAASIQANYYKDVDREDLIEGLYQGLFNSLDAYSCYYTATEYSDLYEMQISGSYCGIGATLSQNINTMIVEVIRVQKDSPAEKAGIQAGDILIRADEYESTAMELSEFVTHVKGEEGTTVTIEVYRESEEKYYTFEVVRAQLDIETVTYDMLENNTGYLQILEFSGKALEQYEAALGDLQAQGMTSLIVDLRDNPGGTLSTVTEMLNDILSDGMIVYTEDKYGNRNEYVATGTESLDIPMVVLVNGNSASASEIFAGALQDHGVATVIGTTTFGKGIVQGIQELTDGSGMKMTTSSYYTPSGKCIHEVGIVPDVEIEYEFLGSDTDEYDYQYDNQIQKALEILSE